MCVFFLCFLDLVGFCVEFVQLPGTLGRRIGLRSVSDQRIWFAVEHFRSYRQGIHRRIRINLCISCIIVLLEMVIKLLGFVWDFQIRGLCRKLRMK